MLKAPYPNFGHHRTCTVLKKIKCVKDHFFQLLSRCCPTRLTFVRNTGRTEELAASQLPSELEKLVQRRSGFEYPLVEVDAAQHPGKTLGLILCTRQHKVYVTAAKQGTIAGNFFKPSDRILALNSVPVSDREVARALIVSSKGKFNAVIERAATEIAKREVKQLEESYRAEVAKQTVQAKRRVSDMPQDVQQIVEAQRERMKSPGPEKRAILQRTTSNDKKVTVTPGHQEVEIASDVDPTKKLRIVPRG